MNRWATATVGERLGSAQNKVLWGERQRGFQEAAAFGQKVEGEQDQRAELSITAAALTDSEFSHFFPCFLETSCL